MPQISDHPYLARLGHVLRRVFSREKSGGRYVSLRVHIDSLRAMGVTGAEVARLAEQDRCWRGWRIEPIPSQRIAQDADDGGGHDLHATRRIIQTRLWIGFLHWDGSSWITEPDHPCMAPAGGKGGDA